MIHYRENEQRLKITMKNTEGSRSDIPQDRLMRFYRLKTLSKTLNDLHKFRNELNQKKSNYSEHIVFTYTSKL